MSGSQLFVAAFALASIIVTLLGIWRVAQAPEARYKPLWIVGSLFGFIGFATNMATPGDLYLQFGIQIPLIKLWTNGQSDLVLKALFPVVAAAALLKIPRARRCP